MRVRVRRALRFRARDCAYLRTDLHAARVRLMCGLRYQRAVIGWMGMRLGLRRIDVAEVAIVRFVRTRDLAHLRAYFVTAQLRVVRSLRDECAVRTGVSHVAHAHLRVAHRRAEAVTAAATATMATGERRC